MSRVIPFQPPQPNAANAVRQIGSSQIGSSQPGPHQARFPLACMTNGVLVEVLCRMPRATLIRHGAQAAWVATAALQHGGRANG